MISPANKSFATAGCAITHVAQEHQTFFFHFVGADLEGVASRQSKLLTGLQGEWGHK
jgi:hypothetical protein